MTIDLDNICFSYDTKQVLHEVTLQIPKGRLTLVCGVTGSGKSTLLRILSGLEKPAGGSIMYSRNDGSPRISMVFQHPETQLFATSVHQDIEYGLEQWGIPKSQRLELIRIALHKVGLPYEQFSQRSPFLLSGGEKRRLCIAGAIATSPSILILDEPTAGLDPPAVRALLDTIQELLHSGITLIIGTHDLDSFFPMADKVIVMSQGTVHYQGPAAPLTVQPDQLTNAGLEPPAYARIGRKLQMAGRLASLPDSAESLLAALKDQTFPSPIQSGSAIEGMGSMERATAVKEDICSETASTDSQSQAYSSASRWQTLDPRVKWLAMVLWSLVILGMNSPLPLLLTTALIIALILSAGISWRRSIRFFKPFLIMFMFLWLLSSLSFAQADWRFGPLGISYSGMIQGGLSIMRFVLLIALGFLFTETTTGAPLREALEWALSPLKRVGIRTRNWSLAVSITLQFIPWILRKIAQLQLALRSRGRQKSGLKRWTPRQISMLIVPLLILVIGMGDELATAVESRGYDASKKRTPWVTLEWQQRDSLALLFILLTTAVLWMLS